MTEPVQELPPDLVGRGAELDAFRKAIAGLRSGRGGTLLVCGEPGIGKTSLARAGAGLAEQASIPAYWGYSWETGGAPAYWPWTQCLGSLLREQTVAPELTAPLAEIMPDVSPDPDAPSLAPEQARFRLLEAARTLFTELAGSSPLIIILEDLHAADQDTLHLLQYLARHAATMPILFIGTYRDVEARSTDASGPLLSTARDATLLNLQRLAEDDVRAYLEQQGNSTVDADDMRLIIDVTAGNPLFLHELTGLISQTGLTGDTRRQLPETVQQVIRQQLGLLPAETTRLLSIASILGRDFGIVSLAMLAGMTEEDVNARLAPAISARMIEATGALDYRYSHTLYRDVLYQDMDAAERSSLHARYAGRLQNLIEAGDARLWSLLASHWLSSGAEQRPQAVAALRQAANHARERLAFDDAAELLQQALAAFGEGPKADPVDRCRLMVDYANSLAFKGEIDEGQRFCEQAFTIARAVSDPQLMADVALTWGRAIVVAKVDPKLIAALQLALDAVPSGNESLRALLLARLAGAMQPARDPGVPMQMARDAIELARNTGDESVVYPVLRSAISALMDFAPVGERIPLNREFETLARQRGDVPDQFRSQLRLIIDAAESGDRPMFDNAIDACSSLADRIGLPHYRWRAASVQAMRAMINGDYQRATDLLDRADALARKAGDLQANVTLAIQRFAILVDWQGTAGTTMADIEKQLKTAFDAGLEDAEFYIAPLIQMYSNVGDKAFAQRFVGNAALVARTFAGNDRYTVSNLGVIAVLAGDHDVARRAYDTLIGHLDHCVTLGLLGGCWCGPISYWLGLIAHGLGELDAARDHFERAIAVAERMGARAELARIHKSFATFADDIGDERLATIEHEAANRLVDELGLRRERGVPGQEQEPPAPASKNIALARDGEHWTVAFSGDTTTIRDSKGIAMLARLLERPEQEVHVLDLVGAIPTTETDAGPLLDEQAKNAYRKRVGELREELEDAEDMADLARAEALREELDFISRELSRAFGIGGRERSAGKAAERARVNVRRRIKDAIQRIEEHLPGAGRYLESTVKTGTYCVYRPL